MNRPELDLRQLHAFTVVAEELHFGRAAIRLGIAQPPLSQQIRRLEDKVGCGLFERGTRRVVLTDAGAVLLAAARRALDGLSEGLDDTRRIGRGEAGRLQIGFPATVALGVLPAVIRTFRERHPAVELQLAELSTAAQQTAIHDGRIDLGFLREPEADPAMRMEPVLREPLVAVLPASHPQARTRGPVRVGTLAEDPFVMIPRALGAAFHESIVNVCRAAGFTPRIVQEALEWQTVVALVKAGLGVSLAPASIAQLHLAEVVFKPLPPSSPSTLIGLCWRRNNNRPAVQRFVEVVRSVVRKPGPNQHVVVL